MGDRASRRYAEALFQLAQETGQLDWLEQELEALVQITAGAPELRRLLDHPEVPRERKFGLLDRVLAGAVSPVLLSLLKLLVERGRQQALGAIAADFGALADAARGLLRVQVTSAVRLSEEQLERLTKVLSHLTGKRIALESEVDPEVLAGAQVRIGDRVIDGSARTRLERLRANLREVGRQRR